MLVWTKPAPRSRLHTHGTGRPLPVYRPGCQDPCWSSTYRDLYRAVRAVRATPPPRPTDQPYRVNCILNGIDCVATYRWPNRTVPKLKGRYLVWVEVLPVPQKIPQKPVLRSNPAGVLVFHNALQATRGVPVPVVPPVGASPEMIEELKRTAALKGVPVPPLPPVPATAEFMALYRRRRDRTR